MPHFSAYPIALIYTSCFASCFLVVLSASWYSIIVFVLTPVRVHAGEAHVTNNKGKFYVGPKMVGPMPMCYVQPLLYLIKITVSFLDMEQNYLCSACFSSRSNFSSPYLTRFIKQQRRYTDALFTLGQKPSSWACGYT